MIDQIEQELKALDEENMHPKMPNLSQGQV